MKDKREPSTSFVSIIIPTLNESGCIADTLDALSKLGNSFEVIVVDGGSADDTARVAREHGVRLLNAGRGRGSQMHVGALQARGSILWFLHADTAPPADALERIAESLRDEQVVGGSFDVEFDSRRLSARFVRWFYRQMRRFGLCYGDSGIFVRREAYERIGGFMPFPIFEDLDLVRRLRKLGRLVQLDKCVITSSRRFANRVFLLTFARWIFLQLLYWAGVNPVKLGRLYGPVRDTGTQDETNVIFGASQDGLLRRR